MHLFLVLRNINKIKTLRRGQEMRNLQRDFNRNWKEQSCETAITDRRQPFSVNFSESGSGR